MTLEEKLKLERNEGWESGRQEGLLEGLIEGEQKDIVKGQKEMILKLMNTMTVSEVAKLLHLSEAELKKLIEL